MIWKFCSLSTIIFCFVSTVFAAELNKVDVNEIGSKTRIIIDLNERVEFTINELQEPFRLVVSFKSKVFSQEQAPKSYYSDPVKKIRFINLETNTTSSTGLFQTEAVIAELNDSRKYEAFNQGNSIYIDITSKNSNQMDDLLKSSEIDPEIEKLLESAQINYSSGYYLLARSECESLLNLDPDNTQAKRLMRRIKRAIDGDKTEADLLANQIAGEKELGLDSQKEDAKMLAMQLESEYQVSSDKEDEFKTLVKRGKRYYKKKRYEEALSVWEEAQRIKDDSQLQENINKARKKIKQQRKSNGSNSDLDEETAQKVSMLVDDGKEYYSIADYDKAIETLERVLELDPYNLEAKRYLANARSKQFNVDDSSPLDNSYDESYSPILNDNLGTLTIDRAIEIGLTNHLPSKIAQEEVILAKRKVKDSKRALFPKVKLKYKTTGGTTTGEDFEAEEYAAEFQQSLYSGGSIRYNYNRSRVNLAVSRKNYEKTKAEFIFEVRQAYYNMVFAKAKLKNKQELVKKSKELVEVAEKKFAVKGMTLAEILDVRSQHQEVKFQTSEIENDYQIAKMALLQLLFMPTTSDVDVVEIPDPVEFDLKTDELIQVAYKNRRDYQVKKLLVLFNKYGLEVAKRKRGFNVELNGSFGQHDEYFISEQVDLESEYYIGLKVTKPIGAHQFELNTVTQDKVPQVGQTTPTEFDSIEATLKLWEDKDSTKMAEASISYHKAISQLENSKRKLVHDVRTSIFSALEASSKIKNKRALVSLAQEEIRSIRAKQQLDQGTLVQVMRAESKYWNAKSDLINSRADYFIAIGRLNKHIGINDYFDPAKGVVALDKDGGTRGIKLLVEENKRKKKWFQFSPFDQGIASYYPDEVVTDVLREKDGGRKPKGIFSFLNRNKKEDPFDEYKLYEERYEFSTPADKKKRKWLPFGKKKDDDFSKFYKDEKEYEEAFKVDDDEEKKKGFLGSLFSRNKSQEEIDSVYETRTKKFKEYNSSDDVDEFEEFLKDKDKILFAEFHVEDNNDETIIAIRTNSKVKYNVNTLTGPARIVITFKEKIISALPDYKRISIGEIKALKTLQMDTPLSAQYRDWKKLVSLIVETTDSRKFKIKSGKKIFKIIIKK